MDAVVWKAFICERKSEWETSLTCKWLIGVESAFFGLFIWDFVKV